MGFTQEITTLDELKSFLKSKIKPLLKKKCIVLLSGDLGAGKTQTVKFLVELLNGKGATSPTFSVINEYKTKIGDVYHIDLYRIKDEEDLESTGFWDLFQTDSVIMIEWPEKVPSLAYPSDWSKIEIQIALNKNRRTLTIA